MTHGLCTAGAYEGLPYFQRLWRTLLAPNIDPRTRLKRLLEHETGEFDLKYAFLSHIDLESETERFEVVHGSHELLKPDTTVPLSKTYCRKTIAAPEGTLAVSDALAEGWEDDPAYDTFELESYLGTTISVDNGLYGTLCFADTHARATPLIDEEKVLVEMFGQWVEYTLTLWDEPLSREKGFDAIEGRSVSSDAIESMMDALQSPIRRLILLSLVGDTTETSTATLERRVSRERDQIKLYHKHLPKLTDAGYIQWDSGEDTISRGPRFSEAEPLLQLLKEYNTEFPV